MASRFCPWCGASLKPGSRHCAACERQTGNDPDGQSNPGERKRLSDMDAYKGVTVPAWLFVVIVALALLALVLVFVTAGD